MSDVLEALPGDRISPETARKPPARYTTRKTQTPPRKPPARYTTRKTQTPPRKPPAPFIPTRGLGGPGGSPKPDGSAHPWRLIGAAHPWQLIGAAHPDTAGESHTLPSRFARSLRSLTNPPEDGPGCSLRCAAGLRLPCLRSLRSRRPRTRVARARPRYLKVLPQPVAVIPPGRK